MRYTWQLYFNVLQAGILGRKTLRHMGHGSRVAGLVSQFLHVASEILLSPACRVDKRICFRSSQYRLEHKDSGRTIMLIGDPLRNERGKEDIGCLAKSHGDLDWRLDWRVRSRRLRDWRRV